MNKIIKEQLDNVLNVNINYSDSDTTIFIPKLKSIQSNNLVLNNIYLVLFDKNVQDKESSLCSNWNRGRVPSQLKYKCEVLQKMGKVYQLNGSAPAIAALSSGGCMGDAVQTNRKEYQTTRIQRQVLRHHKVWRKHKGQSV